ncbi:DNA translocase FtsK 4TM domain-containing protein, partial [Planctomycetota bacterium]
MTTATRAKKKKKNQQEPESTPETCPAVQEAASTRAVKLREILALALAITAVMAILSLLTYHPEDIPGEAYLINHTGHGLVHNYCGKVGAWFAFQLFTFIGYSAYMLTVLFFGWSCALFVRREVRDLPLKITGMFFLTGAGAAFLSLTFRNSLSIPTAGGLFGEAFAQWLQTYLGHVGSYLFVTLVSAMAFILATDWMFYDVVKQLITNAKNRRETAGENQVFIPDESPDAILADEEPFLPEDETDEDEKEIASDMQAEQEFLDEELKRIERESIGAEKRRVKEEAKAARKKKSKKISDGEYILPSTDLLSTAKVFDLSKENSIIATKARIIEETLKSFNIDAKVVNVERGPVITQFEMELAAGIKVNRVLGLQDNLAMNLKAAKLRVIAPIPGKSTVGIELPNMYKEEVRLKELLDTCIDKVKKFALPIMLGKDSRGAPILHDLRNMPHLLIAGATGSGKSVCLNSIILSLLITR